MVALEPAGIWIYLLAPCLGAALAVPAWLAVRSARRPAPLAADPPRAERL